MKIVLPEQVLVIRKEYSFVEEKKEKLINIGRLQGSAILQMTPKGKLEIMCKQFHLSSQRLLSEKNVLF